MPARHTASSPILVVDKQGFLGNALADVIQESELTILVSGEALTRDNIIFVPFHKKIPLIPDNTFSHIFIVYSGEKELEVALPSFVAKARETGAQLVFITSIFHFSESILHKLFALYEKSKVIVTGDIFPSAHADHLSPVNLLLRMVKEEERLELAGSGLELLYPVFLKDVVEGIMAVGFQSTQERELYALVPPHPSTQLTFARTLQKHYPQIKIDFGRDRTHPPHATLPSYAIPLLRTPYPLENRLKKLELAPLSSRQNNVMSPPSYKKRYKVNSRRKFLVIASLLSFVASLPFLLTIGLALLGGLTLKQAENELEQGNLSAALRSSKASNAFFTTADDTASTLRSVVSVIGLTHEVVGFQTLIHTGREVSSVLAQILAAGNRLEMLFQTKKPISKQSFIQAINDLKVAMTSLQTIQAEGNLPATYQTKLKDLEEPLTLLINLIDTSPQILGFDKPMRFLVLFQNNAELRPTGGFIGSYGLLTLDKGKMTSFTVHDVYDADGKLTADIEPPFPLRRYLGASHWFLRDSNFAIDFPKSAAEAASFLKLETGERVDGVIGIDVTFLSSLLKATGPIRLTDYEQMLTSDNFYLLTQQNVERNFFPGSTQKKDFLQASQQALLTRLEEGKFSYRRMAQILTEAVSQKHLLVAFSDAQLQKVFRINNLSSSLLDSRQGREDLLLDSVGLNEANVGQNKANFYLKRSIKHEVMIDGEGIVNEKVAVTYSNTSSNNTEFGGDYKAYVRLITPGDTTLTAVLLDNIEQAILPAVTNENIYLAKSFKPGKGVEIEETVEKGQKIFGLYLNVPQGQTKTLTFAYRLQKRAEVAQSSWGYALLIRKQPGTLEDHYKLSVTYPLANKLFRSNLPVSDLGGKFVYESSLLTDQNLLLTFTQR